MTRFLFAGDSVTDAGRTFFAPAVGAGELGVGWVRVVAGALGLREPEQHTVLNAGVSGDRVGDLLDRWDRDVVAHAPEVLTILVGVNDSLRQPHTPPSAFASGFAELLARVPASVERLVVMEPFVLAVDPVTAELRSRHLVNRQAVRAAVRPSTASHVPLDDVFQDACARAAPAWWAPDGVHPSTPGHALIARAWLCAVAGHLMESEQVEHGAHQRLQRKALDGDGSPATKRTSEGPINLAGCGEASDSSNNAQT